MKYITLALVLWLLSSCARDKRLDDYYQIVDRADKILFYSKIDDTFILSKEVDSVAHLQNLKNILKRHIEPESQRKFVASQKIEIYEHGNLLGVLLISDPKENPFVNFTNDKFGFGFKLTYGIGMSL